MDNEHRVDLCSSSEEKSKRHAHLSNLWRSEKNVIFHGQTRWHFLWAACILKLRAVFLCCWRICLVCLALELVEPGFLKGIVSSSARKWSGISPCPDWFTGGYILKLVGVILVLFTKAHLRKENSPFWSITGGKTGLWWVPFRSLNFFSVMYFSPGA